MNYIEAVVSSPSAAAAAAAAAAAVTAAVEDYECQCNFLPLNLI